MTSLHARLRCTDILMWPASIRSLAFEVPWLSVPLDVTPDAIALLDGDLPEIVPFDLFPKLAIKSWQDSGRLRMIPADVPLRPMLERRLASPTVQQRAVLTGWTDAEMPPHFHLFAWRDMSQISELRCSWSRGRASITSALARNGSNTRDLDIRPLMTFIADLMPALDSFVVQLAAGQDGEIKIVDINPHLTANEIALLIR